MVRNKKINRQVLITESVHFLYFTFPSICYPCGFGEVKSVTYNESGSNFSYPDLPL